MLNDAVRIRSRGLNSDMLYNLPDQPLSSSPAPKKGRQAFKKLARPKKTFSSALSHPWPRAIAKESSQLITTPDLKKRPSTRLSTQLELFSSASITKPVVGTMKVITTEDVLKGKSISLGETTMQKLASYRFEAASHCLTDFEGSGSADSMKGVIGEQESAHHDTTSYEEEAPNHIYRNHGLTSHREVELHSVFEDHELMSYNEDELSHEFNDINPTAHNERDPCHVFDEATVLNHDDGVIMMEEEETSTSQREAIPVAQPDAEDEFPVNDELEIEMTQLLMPDKNYESSPANLLLQALQSDNLQSRSTARVHFQLYSPTSHTVIGDNTVPRQLDEAIDWPSMKGRGNDRASAGEENRAGAVSSPANPTQARLPAESDDYSPLKPFARPGFPAKVRDRSPITGVSSSIILRTCFRIGEALREGALCGGLEQDAVIELFARVKDSSYDIVTPSKLYYEFADLFHDRPPFIRGTLENNRISCMQETESRMLLGDNTPPPMVRCLGRLKRVISGPPGWMLYIVNIRPTDWEEVRWTKQIAGAGMAK